MTLPPLRLQARLATTDARLIRLCAPPGYGKSALVSLVARRFDRRAVCDCGDVSGAAQFAARVLGALAAECGGSESVALARLRLHVAEADAAAWSRAMLEAWKARDERALFVLERAEAIAHDEESLALVGDLLAACPRERVVLISSREPLPAPFARYLAPHHILTLAPDELRFDDEEACAIFEGTEASREVVERIVRLADGRPVVLLLLGLFAQYEADLDRLLDRLEYIAGDALHEHLASEVLSGCTPGMSAALLALAAIPNAMLEDVSAATGIRHASAVVERLLRLPGFVSADAGTYRTHPVIVDALRARFAADAARYVLAAARAYEKSGDVLRAAELYLARGDRDDAARALDRLPQPQLQQPTARAIDALVSLSPATLCAQPNLWIAMLPHRRQKVEASRLYAEAQQLRAALTSDASPSLHRRLLVRLAMLASELGRFAEARKLLDDGGPARQFDEAPEEQRLALMTAAVVAARQGRFSDASESVDEADAVQGARHLRFEAERAQIAFERARYFGDWNGALKIGEEALYAAQASGVTSRIVEAARATAQAAWCSNDDARTTSANQLLESCGAPRYVEPWHAALQTTNVDEAKAIFEQAIDESDRGEDTLARVAVRVAAALTLSSQRRHLLEARVIAAPVESPPLHASLELLIDSPEPADYGIFKHLAERVARSPLKVRADVLFVDVLRGRLRRGGEVLHVSDRGFELLAALALLPAGTSKEGLAAAIWPALDGDAALNTLKMCVSRARAQTGERDAIRSTKSGYELGERVTVDVREFERLLRAVRGTTVLGEGTRRQVEAAARALGTRQRGHTSGWAWFAPYAAQLEALSFELAQTLARTAPRRFEGSLTS
jgi:tetratricopeptide (TPR) repeat protein